MQAVIRNMEIIAGALAAAIILIGTVVIQAPLWLSVLLGAALFTGLRLIKSHWTEISIANEARGLSQDLMEQKILAGQSMVVQIKNLSRSIKEEEVQAQVLRICDLADKIFRNFQDDKGDMARASRFLLYLNRFLPLIETFARLSSTKEGRKMLEESNDGKEFREMLNVVEQGFSKGFQNYLENDAADLRTFGRVLSKMMDAAEIGKQ
ncbi:5-bromo-4-chloroindolyl phosphate hydrolysis protein [Desulfatibacillum alkenivorans DSM 16219]|jgi:hypothetical protein|uniref:5-bromo-4-chloroindolyl phosphate hydrolysis protein n=1 Tax=Desulfatibacillum alkenivorans DSM 16219 TaxID=1121393 RepID=A0A1M6VKL2_9BACT|nr:5-bromo-4-chloroindolyl phosphate hydrolysis family protein [Desulfatibacillum alkenivorans]SHK81894.1 5-bromo-4-chloroindolyl phosphate hydrolysis protein [Desulfatibacillum alkenivorans DSM 16219]